MSSGILSRTRSKKAVWVDAPNPATVPKPSNHYNEPSPITPRTVVRLPEPSVLPGPSAFTAAFFTGEARISEDDTIHVQAMLSTVEEADDVGDERSAEEVLGFKPSFLGKCEVPQTIEEMRPSLYQPLNGKPTRIPVPRNNREITETWCTAAFRASGFLGENESVIKIKLTPLGAGGGEFSDLVLMDIQVDGPAPKLSRGLVAKFSSPKMSSIETKVTFGHECHFYNDMSVEAGGLVRPQAVYVGYEKKGTRYCIIQELCHPAVSFKRVDGCSSVAHMRLVMRCLARFHARWWGHKQEGVLAPYLHPQTGGGPFMKVPSSLTTTLLVLGLKTGLKALAHCFSSDPSYEDTPKFAAEYASFIAHIRPIIRRRRHAVVRELWLKKPFTLVHGDAHLENIFFGEQYQGGCAFIDFGLLCFGSGLGDVATVISGGMPIASRRMYEKMLVKEYHATLTVEFGVKDYPWEQCWSDFSFQLFKPVFYLLFIAPAFLKQRKAREGVFSPNPNEGDVKLAKMYEQLNKRLAQSLIDHKWAERVAEMPFTAGYCCRPLS